MPDTPNANRGRARAAIAGIALASATLVTAIQGDEGTVLHTYYDIVGVPTACSGITDPDIAVPGREFTKLECQRLDAEKIEVYSAKTLSCITVPVKQLEFEAYVRLSYNIGPESFCASTLLRQLNAGNHLAACGQILRWDRAGGRVITGLHNRRVRENKQCVEALR